MSPIWLHSKASVQGQVLYIRAFFSAETCLGPESQSPLLKKTVPEHHLLLSMSSGDLNSPRWLRLSQNLQLLKNVLKRSWLSDYSNLWDSGLSGRSLAVNGRCNGSECLERYRYIVCSACVAHISLYCMPVQVVDCLSKFQSTGRREREFLSKSHHSYTAYLVKAV